jgi:CubicO group peptidase (beta-lactamase class C family)
MKIEEKLLNSCLDKIISKKNIFGAVLRVESGDASFTWAGARGEMQPDSKFFIASVTKLYVTAIVMSLIEDHKLSFKDKIAKHLQKNDVENLHVLKGVDYSNEITIKHLISNTSGIPDYFFYKENGVCSADSLMEGKDDPWDFEKAIQYAKKMMPKFTPGQKGKVNYSDTNYQILGKIIETVTGKDISKVFEECILSKLGLRNTYVYSEVTDSEPAAFYYREKRLWLPKYMASIGAEGGIVSTAEEVAVFLKAFFSGRFFPKEKIESLKDWKLLLPPPGTFYFGIGLEKQFVPRIVSPRKPISEVIGFWGQTSSFAWYNPDTDLYFSGTANQLNGAGHSATMSAIIKIIKSVI